MYIQFFLIIMKNKQKIFCENDIWSINPSLFSSSIKHTCTIFSNVFFFIWRENSKINIYNKKTYNK